MEVGLGAVGEFGDSAVDKRKYLTTLSINNNNKKKHVGLGKG